MLTVQEYTKINSSWKSHLCSLKGNQAHTGSSRVLLYFLIRQQLIYYIYKKNTMGGGAILRQTPRSNSKAPAKNLNYSKKKVSINNRPSIPKQ